MDSRVLMAHGSGGLMSQQLVDEVFRSIWSNQYLDAALDGAQMILPPGKVAMSTDSFVITPIFFPGGDIGKLSICGTVNDLVACGAKPMYMSVGLIIEEGFLLSDLRKIAESMAKTAAEVGIQIVTGDTKVVERGSADGIFINTTGIGVISGGIEYTPQQIKAGDYIIATGNIGDHGLAILAQREGLQFSTPVVSDCAPLYKLGETLQGFPGEVRCMRDPTRGGLATVLNELAQQSGLGMMVKESNIPVSSVVKGACDMLGMDPLYMANEGKMIVIVGPDRIDQIIHELKSAADCQNAAVIGRVTAEPAGMVLIETELGAQRIMGMLEGEHLPRIC
ncbi:MAG: hydrogenase expression/formation protein HypE [Deltaproteobacteria bacterium]